MHVPFQDKELYKNIFKFIKDLKLLPSDEIIINGDLADFFGISSFEKVSCSIISADDIQYERVCIKEFLRDLRKAAGCAKIIYVLGNHEKRWEKYLGSGAKALSKVPELMFENFFGLQKYKISYKDTYKPNPEFLCKHGDATSKFPSKTELDKELISGCTGHAHRTDRSYRRGYEKRLIWFSLGHTALKSLIDTACKFSTPMRWDQSFGLLISDLKNNNWDMEVMHCENANFYSKFLRKQYGKN